jgi:hypothetical protein
MKSGEWNLFGIIRYIDAYSRNFEEDGQATAMSTYPNCSGEFMQDWIRSNWEELTSLAKSANIYSDSAGFKNLAVFGIF